MLYKQNENIQFCTDKCTQCGVCLSVCPRNAISYRRGREIYKIEINEELCIKCGRCVSACAANLLPDAAPNEESVNGGKCYLAYSSDDNTRFYASSGGVCRELIHEALALKLVDAVYSLSYSAGNQEEISGKWFVSPPQNIDLPQSIYRVVLWGEHILELPEKVQRVLLVGLPCQLRAANTILKRIKSQLEIVSIAILCRKTKTLGFSRYISRMCGKRKVSLRFIRYRGEGWPGKMRVDGKTSYTNFVYHAQCWNLKGCRRCFDNYYMEGDFTIGDPWGIVERGKDENGQSLLFVHSKSGNDFLDKIKSVKLQPLDDKTASEFMGLEISRCKEREYKAHPNGNMFHKIKKVIGETVLAIKSFLQLLK